LLAASVMLRSTLRSLLCASLLVACGRDSAPDGNAHTATAAVVDSAAGIAVATPWLTPERRAAEDTLFHDAAAAAWAFADRNYQPRTGLIRPFDGYAVSTMWDIASGLAAMYSAEELGLLARPEYDKRMATALQTLATIPLFENVGFNKEYATQSGQIIGIERQPAATGFGTSATDQGCLLLWLRIIAAGDPTHRAAAERVANRVKKDQYIRDGYLYGRQVARRDGKVRGFQEGRLGYEQYAARGFTAWGAMAEKASDVNENAKAVQVSGVELVADKRGGDRLTSEPWMLMGLESGWTPAERRVAEGIVAAQEARFKATDTLTMVSEDAIDIAPDYFFYYTVLSKNGPWSIDVQRNAKVNGPRWISTKAAFAWHALLPNDYTRRVLDTVRSKAKVGGVWGSGVFDNGRPTATPNINTAAVVLESALYRKRNAPLIKPPA
jgi:hypothetical protein